MLPSASLQVCTIIAKNYVAHARVLARSLAEHHPGSRLWTLVVDDFDGFIDPASEPFEVLRHDQIGCEVFYEMALRYTVLELSTAVKPWLLRHLMGETGEPITYLDPDIRIYGSLERLDELARAHGLALTPHNIVPIPEDDRRPSQVDILVAGVFNLGCASMAPGGEIEQLLDWWSERLRRDCRVDPLEGYFVDQRWFDLAPGFLRDYAVVREPEYNVAYWNLHARQLSANGGSYLVNGRPLRFFHFSGFDPDHPLVLSRHQDRVDAAADPVLERVLAEYAVEVNAEGHGESRRWPYTYDTVPTGMVLDRTARALYGTFADEQPANGAAPSLFTKEGARAFEDWLVQSAPTGPPGINRVLDHVYRERNDLRGAYRDPGGADREQLLSWVTEYGQHEIPLLAWLGTGAATGTGPGAGAGDGNAAGRARSGATPRTSADEEPLKSDRWGVNVVGYFRSEAGTGEAARQVVSALDAAGVATMPIHGQTVPISRQGYAYATASTNEAAFPVNLICMNADMLPEFAQQAGNEFFAGRYSIGVWFWEVSAFPEQWHGSFSLLEEVWAPTAHIADALERVATVPVTPVRIPVQPPAPELRSRAEMGLPADDAFLFLFNFDYLSVFKRKNPLAVIAAFREAFDPGEGAKLVLKCINPDRDPESHAQLLAAAAEHPDIAIMDRYLSPGGNLGLTALCDCYVSLHRAEGFGLVMAEAMWLGKPVIATAYSGNMDFMTDSNSLLVDHTLIPIGTDAEPYPPRGVWADPDIGHAAGLMRRVFEDREAARALGATAALDIRRTHSPAAAGEIMYRRLESIRGTGRARPADRVRDLPPTLARLPLRIGQGPLPMRGNPSYRRGRQLVRKTILRAIRPFSVYQQGVNKELVAALRETNERLHDLSEAAAAERALLTGELRAAERRLAAIEARTAGEAESSPAQEPLPD